MPGPVALPGLNDANPVRQNTAIRQISERLDDYAPLDSPVLTGDPQAPTPDLADNDTSIATTAYVQGQNYTTKTYVDGANATQDTAIAGKAAAVHTHAQSDVTGLVAALAGKEPTITGSGNATDYWGGDKAFHAIPAQKLVSVSNSRYTATTGLTTQFLNTGTVPTSTQGTQIISVSVTTTTATQVIDFWFEAWGICSQACSAGVYVGSTCVAAQTILFNTSGSAFNLPSRYSPGAAGTYTFSVRVGPNTAATLTLNASFGAASVCGLTVYVIEP